MASEYRYIVRIAGKDIEGSKPVIVGLSQIRGIGFNFAQALLGAIKLDPNKRLGFLSEGEVAEIERGIKEPSSLGLPAWFVNRQKDVETGTTKHLIGSDIEIAFRNDIEREKDLLSWRGTRHMLGLKVRGQCTRTTGRKGGAVGVRKGGRIIPGAPGAEAAGAPAGAAAAGAPGAAAPAAGAKEAPKEAPKKPAEKGAG